MPVPEVVGQQEQMVSDWHAQPGPLRDPRGGERVAKVVDTRPGPAAVGRQALRELAKPIVDGALRDRPATLADKKVIGQYRALAPDLQVALQCEHRGWMQGKNALRTEFSAGDAKRPAADIEISDLKAKDLADPHPGAACEADDGHQR